MKFKRTVSLLPVLILAGCVNNPSFQPLENRLPQDSSKIGNLDKKPQYHVVNKGETLYSIALQYDLDYRVLASNNQVDQNFYIIPGQRLSLQITSPVTSPKTLSVERPQTSNTSITPAEQSPSSNMSTAKPVIKLSWPIDKTKVRTKESIVRQLKGIDIRSEIGDSVLAAANGEVVFAGSGLRGYGNLIIIQHTDDILTAYAYTREILVKEKQVVKTGDRIATVGTSGKSKSSVLHFEVRQNGKPLDPLIYLPM